MSTSETLEAFEEGLITEQEAVEQAMVESVDALYERAAVERIEDVSDSMRRASRTTLGYRQ